MSCSHYHSAGKLTFELHARADKSEAIWLGGVSYEEAKRKCVCLGRNLRSGVPYIFVAAGKVPSRRDQKYKGRLIAGYLGRCKVLVSNSPARNYTIGQNAGKGRKLSIYYP